MSIEKFFKRVFGGANDYIEAAAQAVTSGEMTDADLEHLHKIAIDLGMSSSEIVEADVKAVEMVMKGAMQDNVVTEADLNLFKNAMNYLHVNPSWISPQVSAQLHNILLLQQIAAGHLPALPRNQVPLALQPGELAHLVAPCSIQEEKVVSRQSTGGYSGFSFRICRGVRYHVGGYRGHSVPVTANVTVSHGNLILTSMRAVYLGDKKGFNAPWSKINEVEPFRDGARFYFTNKANASTLRYAQTACAPFVEALCAQLLH